MKNDPQLLKMIDIILTLTPRVTCKFIMDNTDIPKGFISNHIGPVGKMGRTRVTLEPASNYKTEFDEINKLYKIYSSKRKQRGTSGPHSMLRGKKNEESLLHIHSTNKFKHCHSLLKRA